MPDETTGVILMDDKKIIYSMLNVGKTYPPNKQVLRDISLSYFYGAKIGVLGLNGSGKSTLLKIIAGIDKEYNGETHIAKEYSVGYLEQDPFLDKSKTVKEVVQEGAQEIVSLLREFDQINDQFGQNMSDDEMNKLIERQAKVQDQLDSMDAWTLDDRLEYAMDALRCPASDKLVEVLSGGERRRVALCRLLIQSPDILLLDEPTNHLDAESVAWLERYLQEYKGTVIAVTHDRYFLDNVAGWILELDRGRGIPWKGNYSSWLDQKQKRLSTEKKDTDKRRRTLERELEWIRLTPKAKHTKNKARISAYNKLASQETDQLIKDLEIFIPPGPRLGDQVIEVENLAKSFDYKLLFEGLEFKLPPGGIVGVIGGNGSGKSTLFNILYNELRPDSGHVKIGQSVKLGYMEQANEVFNNKNNEKTVWEMVSNKAEFLTLGKREINSRAYIARFNFSGEDQQKKVGMLSGGEKNRLKLAMMLKQESNVLLLDEPTNDLDVNTLRALEEGLYNFAGCAVVISHDRWFLDRIATHILAFEGDSEVVWFDGNYSEYEEDLKRRKGKTNLKPERIKYRTLTR